MAATLWESGYSGTIKDFPYLSFAPFIRFRSAVICEDYDGTADRIRLDSIVRYATRTFEHDQETARGANIATETKDDTAYCIDIEYALGAGTKVLRVYFYSDKARNEAILYVDRAFGVEIGSYQKSNRPDTVTESGFDKK